MPSFPTLSIASAIIEPISRSLFADIVAICLTSLDVFTGVAIADKALTITSTDLSIPRFRLMGLAPALTFLAPAVKIASARTIAVVVPSPATSDVFEATSLTNWAPIFSNLSLSTTSLATVTPSFVERGEPKPLLITTLRPFGPNVTLTTRARVRTPFNKDLRASSLNCSIFDMS